MCDGAPAADELGAVGFYFDRSGFGAFHDGDVRCPNLGVIDRAAPSRGDDNLEFGQIVGHDKHLGKRRVRLICRLRGQRQFCVRGQIHLAGMATGVRQRHSPRLGIIFRRNDNFGHRSKIRCLVCKGRVVFAEDGSMAGGIRPHWLGSG